MRQVHAQEVRAVRRAEARPRQSSVRSLLQRVEALVAEGTPGSVNRRRFLELLSAAAAGAIALPYVPQKLYFVGGWPDSDVYSQAWADVATYGGLTAEQRTFYSERLLKRLLPNLPLERYLDHPRIVDAGQVAQFRRWGELALPTEGAEVTAILSQYGSWSVLS